MIYLDRLTNDPMQQYTLVGENGEQIPFSLRYLPRQQSWMYSISYGDFTANGKLLHLSINALRQWKNIIPFGLCIMSSDGFEPYYINDFVTDRVQLYLLDAAEVAELEQDLFEPEQQAAS